MSCQPHVQISLNFKIYKTNLIADAAPSAQKPRKNSAQATPKTPNAVESTQPTATQQASFHKVENFFALMHQFLSFSF